MIPYQLKDQHGKIVMEFKIPSSWEESTLRQMIQWREEAKKGDIEFCKQLEIMTGVPESDWLNCSAVNVDTLLLPNLEWMKEPLSEAHLASLPVPETVTINGKEIFLTKDIDLKTFGQKITMQTEMAKYAVKNSEGNITGFELNFFPVAIGIYLYPEEKFSDAKAFEFARHCEELPLKEAYPLAVFFFLKYLESLNATRSSSLTPLPINSKGRASTRWINSVLRTRSMRSRKVT